MFNKSFHLLALHGQTSNSVEFLKDYFSRHDTNPSELVTDFAYIRIILIQQSFAFEMLIKSAYVYLNEFINFQQLNDEVHKIGHQFSFEDNKKLKDIQEKYQNTLNFLNIEIKLELDKFEEFYLVTLIETKQTFRIYNYTFIRYSMLRDSFKDKIKIGDSTNGYKDIFVSLSIIESLYNKIPLEFKKIHKDCPC